MMYFAVLQGATPTAMSLGTISQMHGQYLSGTYSYQKVHSGTRIRR